MNHNFTPEQYCVDLGGNLFVGRSEQLNRVLKMVKLISKTQTTILIQGESGTGKEMVSSAIQFCSTRSNASYIKVNCAALPDTLLESELFGYKKGAFTGAIQNKDGLFKKADGGTILLDEIGCMPIAGQAKLLRVLQEGEFVPVGATAPIKVNVRVLASTNVNLYDAVQKGTFRDDLYYRLKVITINLPPLRKCREDIPLLIDFFISKYCHLHNRSVSKVSPKALNIMTKHDWPGNIRELQHAIEQAVIIEPTDTIHPYSLPNMLFQEGQIEEGQIEINANQENLNLRQKVNIYERQLILRALNEADWKKTAAAKKLGVDRRNIDYFLKKHHITDPMTRLKKREKVSIKSPDFEGNVSLNGFEFRDATDI